MVFQNEVVVMFMTVFHLSNNNSHIQILPIDINNGLIFVCGQNVLPAFAVLYSSDVISRTQYFIQLSYQCQFGRVCA